MSKVLLALTSAALLGLSGCAATETKPADTAATAATADTAKPAISAEAQAALTAAQAAVKEARAKFALWTTAENALKAAEEAAGKGDSDTVLKQSKVASDQAQKGLAQLDYPLIEVPKLPAK